MPLPNTYVAPDANDQLVYTLNESASPWANTGAGGALNMTASTSAVVSPSPCTGLYSNAIFIPGPHDTFNYLSTPVGGTTIGETAGSFSLSCFVYLTNYGNSNYGCFVQKSYRPDTGSFLSPFHGVFLGYDNSNTGRMFVDVIIGATEYVLACPYVVPLFRWVHVGLTFEASTGIIRAYADGTEVARRTTVGAASIDWGTHGPWTIGGEHDGLITITGSVDDVRVANILRPASYFNSFGIVNKNTYMATDASDQLIYTLNEASAPYANTGAAGTLNLSVAGGGTGVIQEGGFYSGGIWLPGPHNSTNYLTTGDSAGTSTAEIAKNFTVSCWAWLRDYSSSNYSNFFGKSYRVSAGGWSDPFYAHRVGIANTNDGTLIYNVTIAGTYYEVRPNAKMPLNTWCHLGYTWDGNVLLCYLSGKQIAALYPLGVSVVNQNIDYGTHGSWFVGGDFSASDSMNGIVDECRVANVVRDQTWFGQFGYFDIPAELPAPAFQMIEATQPDSPGQTSIGPLLKYRMRGFDTNISVNRIVYWNATFVDGAAQQYTGSPGPVTHVVAVQKLV